MNNMQERMGRNRSGTGRGSSLAMSALMMLLVMVGASFAATACDTAMLLDFSPGAVGPTALGNNWKTLCLICMFISGMIISLMYMLGNALGNVALLNRVKTDINQFLATALILVVFFAFVNAICRIDTSQFGLAGPTLFDSARDYVKYTGRLAFAAFMYDMDAMMYISGMGSLYVGEAAMLPLGPLLTIQLSVRPFSGYSVMNGVLQFLSNAVSLSIALSKGYEVILTAIQDWFLNLLLPTGVVLRCFTPTRDFGGVLMSLSIGLFIFYPLLFSLSYLMVGAPNPYSVSIPSSSIIGPTLSMLGIYTAASIIPFGVVGLTASQYLFVSNAAYAKVSTALSSIGGLVLPVFILPGINWIILVVIVRSLSKAMGEEIDISALTRMV